MVEEFDEEQQSHLSDKPFFDENCFSRLNKLMNNDIAQLYKSKSWSNVSDVIDHDPNAWLQARPKQLVKLLEKLTGLKISDTFGSFYIAKTIEQLYGVRNLRLVLPLSFRHNLLTNSFSGSKFLIQLNANLMPGEDCMLTLRSEDKRKTRPKNSTIKLPSTLSVSCMKLQGGHGPPAPSADALCICVVLFSSS